MDLNPMGIKNLSLSIILLETLQHLQEIFKKTKLVTPYRTILSLVM